MLQQFCVSFKTNICFVREILCLVLEMFLFIFAQKAKVCFTESVHSTFPLPKTLTLPCDVHEWCSDMFSSKSEGKVDGKSCSFSVLHLVDVLSLF